MSEALAALGLTDAASPDEVTTRYKQLAREAHPDRGGTVEQFQRLNDAYKTAYAQQTEAPCPICHGAGQVVITLGFHSTKVDCGHCLRTGRRFPRK